MAGHRLGVTGALGDAERGVRAVGNPYMTESGWRAARAILATEVAVRQWGNP